MLSEQRSNTGQLVEGGILAGITVILTLLGIYIPILGMFITFVRAIPIMLVVIRHGIKTGIIAASVAVILVGMIAGPLKAISVLIGTAPLAVILGWCFREQKSPAVTLIYGSIIDIITKLAIIGIAMVFLNINIFDSMISPIREAMPISLELQRKMGADQLTLDNLTKLMEQTQAVVVLLLPAIFILGAVGELYIVYRVAKVVLAKLNYQSNDILPFRHWDLPKGFAYGWVLSFAAWKAGSYFFGVGSLSYKFGSNSFMIFSAALFLQGLAVISYYFNQHQVAKPFRIMAVFLIFLTGVIPMLLVVYGGIYDMFFNFRKLERKG